MLARCPRPEPFPIPIAPSLLLIPTLRVRTCPLTEGQGETAIFRRVGAGELADGPECYRKHYGLTINGVNLAKAHVIETERIMRFYGVQREGAMEDSENEGISENVVENKRRKFSSSGVSENVAENKQVILSRRE